MTEIDEYPAIKLRTREMRGLSGHPSHASWKRMIARCYAKSAGHFDLYGGRGIRVCKRWHWFANFYRDMASSWRAGLSLDRIDCDGHYEPSNCRWATFRTQIHNRRRNLDVLFRGETLKLSALADEYSVVAYPTLYSRIKRGWDVEMALTTPEQRICKRRPFVLDGIEYKTMRSCATILNKSTTAIATLIKSGRGHYL